MTTRILIADDHGLLRAGLKALLENEPGIEVVAEAQDGIETLDLVEALQPDLVLLDLNMPGLAGMQVLHLIKDRKPDVSVLILTMLEDDALISEALELGASGYISKRAVESELQNAIVAIGRGDLYIHPSLTRSLLSSLNLPALSVKAEDPEPLTSREVEILTLLAKGYTNRQIAEQLSLSKRTVETHRANIMGKLDLSDRVDLVRYAIDKKMIT